MSKIVLASSALIALLKNESGSDRVESLLGQIVMSSVTVSETATVLLELGMSNREGQECLFPLISLIVPFDEEQAFYAATLSRQTKRMRLSFEDRACLALGMKMKVPVYTANKTWKNLPLETPTIKFIR